MKNISKTSYPLNLSSVGDIVEIIRYNSKRFTKDLYDIGMIPGTRVGILKKDENGAMQVTSGYKDVKIETKLANTIFVSHCRMNIVKDCKSCNACQKNSCKSLKNAMEPNEK